MMRIEDICCSCEYAKNLKESGIKQNSIFSWIEKPSAEYINREVSISTISYLEINQDITIINGIKKYSAFTASELMNMLPGEIKEKDWCLLTIDKWRDEKNKYTYKSYYINDNSSNTIEDKEYITSSLENSLANLLIYIIDKKLVSLEKINERI